MADQVDEASERTQIMLDEGLARINADIPDGEPGECDWCGHLSPRLVGGACAPCRDRYRLG